MRLSRVLKKEANNAGGGKNRRAQLMAALVGALACATLLRAEFDAYWSENTKWVFSHVITDAHYEPLLVRNSGGPALDPPPARGKRLHSIIQEAARLYGLDNALLHAIIVVESGYDPRAVSRKGAIGLMQLMPLTARRYGVVDPYDPSQNVRGGAQHLRHLLRRFDDDITLSVAAYNAGEQAIIERDGDIPPYPETQRYVLKVLEHYERLKAQSIVAP
jgi:soluble lytic murein transglycosylase-like protein